MNTWVGPVLLFCQLNYTYPWPPKPKLSVVTVFTQYKHKYKLYFNQFILVFDLKFESVSKTNLYHSVPSSVPASEFLFDSSTIKFLYLKSWIYFLLAMQYWACHFFFVSYKTRWLCFSHPVKGLHGLVFHDLSQWNYISYFPTFCFLWY